MLSSLLNLPRRRKSSGQASPSPAPALRDATQDTGREEDGFVLVGQSASERSTVMPVAMQNGGGVAVPPPPSYAQVTGSPSLPPVTVDPNFHNYPSPSPGTAILSPTPIQYNQMQHTSDNRTPNAATDGGLYTSTGLNKSSSTNWGIIDIPFKLSSMLAESSGRTTDYFVPEVREVNWRQYDYDFDFELNVKRESEMALERMEEDDDQN